LNIEVFLPEKKKGGRLVLKGLRENFLVEWVEERVGSKVNEV
jgi:hypothetical protein